MATSCRRKSGDDSETGAPPCRSIANVRGSRRLGWSAREKRATTRIASSASKGRRPLSVTRIRLEQGCIHDHPRGHLEERPGRLDLDGDPLEGVSHQQRHRVQGQHRATILVGGRRQRRRQLVLTAEPPPEVATGTSCPMRRGICGMKCRSPRSAEKTSESIPGVGRKRREPAGEKAWGGGGDAG